MKKIAKISNAVIGIASMLALVACGSGTSAGQGSGRKNPYEIVIAGETHAINAEEGVVDYGDIDKVALVMPQTVSRPVEYRLVVNGQETENTIEKDEILATFQKSMGAHGSGLIYAETPIETKNGYMLNDRLLSNVVVGRKGDIDCFVVVGFDVSEVES